MSTLNRPLFLAIAFGLLIAIVDASLILFVVLRRARRNRYFARKDQVRDHLAGTVCLACRGSRAAIAELQAYGGPAAIDAIVELLLASVTPNSHEAVTQVIVELGYAKRWTKQAFSRYSGHDAYWARAASVIRKCRVFAVRRAVAVGHLGYLHGSVAAPLMIKALQDPSHLVISVAADSLARTGSPTGLKPLLDLLTRAVEEANIISERAAKAALLTLQPLPHELESVYSPRQSKHFRMAILDVLHELLVGRGVTERLANPALLDALHDADFEIRARAVRIIPMLKVNSNAVAAALKDESPFVRLRAVQLASATYPELLLRIEDDDWRVREASVGTLSKSADFGRRQLTHTLLTTRDRYAAEQIIETCQMSGDLRIYMTRLGEENAFFEQLVCRKVVELGMDSMLIDALQPQTPASLLTTLLEITHDSVHPSRASRLALLAQCSIDKVSARARQQLQQFEDARAKVVGAA